MQDLLHFLMYFMGKEQSKKGIMSSTVHSLGHIKIFNLPSLRLTLINVQCFEVSSSWPTAEWQHRRKCHMLLHISEPAGFQKSLITIFYDSFRKLCGRNHVFEVKVTPSPVCHPPALMLLINIFLDICWIWNEILKMLHTGQIVSQIVTNILGLWFGL